MKKLLLAAVALLVASAASAQNFSTTFDGKFTPGFTNGQVSVGGVLHTFPSTASTLARTDAANTFTGAQVFGAVTASGLTFSSTAGVVGSTTNDSAAVGSVGELLSTTVAVGSHVSLSTGTTANMTSVSLTAGDWDVTCNVVHELAAATTVTILSVGLSTTTATVPTIGLTDSQYFRQASAAPGGPITQQVGPHRVSLASTTTLFCAANDTFGTSTDFAYGVIRARRVR